MNKSTCHLPVLFITTHFLFVLMMVSSIPMQFYIGDMDRLMRGKEGTSELLKLNQLKRDRIWKRKTNQYFKAKRSCQDRTTHTACIATFMFCDATPNKSSYERRIILNGKLMVRTPTHVKDSVKIGDFPFYTTDEETCFIASMKPFIARKIATMSCNHDDSPCVIHPLLPMMKPTYQTIDTVSKKARNGASFVTIMVETSPFYKQNQEDLDLKTIAGRSIQQAASITKCHENLLDTFPYTHTTIPCDGSLDPASIEAQWLSESIAAFYINSETDSEEALRSKLLRFTSSLAIRPEFISIEFTDYYYFHK